MPRILHSAVIADVIVNPASVSGEIRKKMGELCKSDPKLIASMPRNSILGILIDDGAGKAETQYSIFFPFFSSHFSMPVKPGETVWIMFDKVDGKDGQGYWLTRKHAVGGAEDLNYTHDPRSAGVISGEGFSGLGMPSFPKGGGGSASGGALSAENDYEILYAGARATSHFSAEGVPRFSKRCGDLVLQGSNNARIVIGDNRANGLAQEHELALPFPVISGIPLMPKIGEKSLREGSHLPAGNVPIAVDPAGGGGGSIDIVAGSGFRTAISLSNPDGPLNAPGGPPIPGINPILPLPIIDAVYVGPAMIPFVAGAAPNSRGQMEFPKDVANDNPHEGDPDFETDLARIFVSMRCNVDEEFGIAEAAATVSSHPVLSMTLDPALTTSLANLGGSAVRGIPLGSGASCVVTHADRVRLIARAEGDIKIVKKAANDLYGIPGMSNDSSICLDGMGNIQISASANIVLTGGIDSIPPAGTLVVPGMDPRGEPYVLYSGLSGQLSTIYGQIDGLCQIILKLVTNVAAQAPTLAPLPMGIGAAVGGAYIAATAPLAADATAISVEALAAGVQIDAGAASMASNRIFGE